jgi:hypothetical protein
MPLASRLAFVVFCVTCVVSASIIATTPDGDKDSHAFMLEYVLVVALPLGLVLGAIGVVQSHRRHTYALRAWIVLLLFIVPTVLITSVLAGWL